MAAGLDEDTARTLQSGRESLGTLLRAAQKHLQKVFVVWVLGLLATIMVLQGGGWDTLRRDLVHRKMGVELQELTEIVVVTPFDVILLQVKIGVVVGIVVALPLVIYYSRDALGRRGYWPDDEVPRLKLAGITFAGFLLFAGGVLYAYELFFPLMFDFLAGNADSAGFLPKYSIVMWFQFVVLLATSFGLAAQLPLAMSALSYTGIVPYETFRDRWKWAVVAIFGFGAMFSPPDPFTQIMWATPLVGLYVISLGISKLLVQTKRAGEEVGFGSIARRRWNKILAAGVLVGAVIRYMLAPAGGFPYVQAFAEAFPSERLTGDIAPPALFGLSPDVSALLIAGLFGLLACLLTLYYYVVGELDVAAAEAGNFGDPTDIDVGSLTAEAVEAAPPEAFEEMDEEEALRLADDAMSDDDPEKAQAILDRFDRAQSVGEGEDGGGATAEDEEEEEGNVFANTTAGMVDAFTEGETTEDDIGGLYYDLRFILDSLTSKAIWLVAVFMIVAGVTFVFLYSGIPGAGSDALATGGTVVGPDGVAVAENATVVNDNVTLLYRNGTVETDAGVLVARNGTAPIRPTSAVIENDSTLVRGGAVYGNASATGQRTSYGTNSTVLVLDTPPEGATSGIGLVKNTFVSNLPPDVRDDVSFVTLHPVEHLIFIVKFSTLLGAVAVIPPLLFLAWPAMVERGLARGNRNVLGVWGGTVFGTLIGGTVFGFLFVAPEVLSWLAWDVINSGMEIRYRVSDFGWLVLLFTVGIGLLVEIPVSMVLFHKGGILPFQRIMEKWRSVTLGVFVISALVSPSSLFTMFLVAVPVTLAFLVGLGLLWLYTLGGRREVGGAREPAD